MLLLNERGKLFYCPIKSNRLMDDSGGDRPYQRVDTMDWSKDERTQGKLIKIKGFPGSYKVKLFRVKVSTDRTDCIMTNDLSCDRTGDAQQVSAVRWKVEEHDREAKGVTGIDECQCRKGRIQRNPIACSLLVWTRLKTLAYETGHTVYQIKHGLLHDYLVQQLRNPSVKMVLA